MLHMGNKLLTALADNCCTFRLNAKESIQVGKYEIWVLPSICLHHTASAWESLASFSTS
jgi:hypothetical protein